MSDPFGSIPAGEPCPPPHPGWRPLPPSTRSRRARAPDEAHGPQPTGVTANGGASQRTGGVAWRGRVQCGVAWRGAAWRGVVKCSVARRG
eukprot:5478015-Prymnesium_polylepis.1